MGALSDCRAVLPTILRDNWRRESKQRAGRVLSAAVTLFLGLLLSAATAATFALEDDPLRRNTLNLLAALAVLSWIVAAVVMRLEMSRFFDFRRLLSLPVRFRALYALRVGAGLFGLWIPLFGPSLLYLLVVRTAGPAGFAVALLATLAFVILLGRLVAIVLLKLDDLNASWITTAALLALAVAALFAVEPVMRDRALDLTDQPVIALIADQVRESRLLAAAGFLPGGVLAAIFEAPSDLGANLARLAGLWVAALACLLVEYRILRSGGALMSAGTDEVGGVHLPLARLLRRTKRLEPSTCLCLIEFDSSMRMKWSRGLLLAGVFMAPMLQTGRMFGLAQALLVTGFFLTLRNNAFGIAHRSIGERFLLPVRPVELLIASGRALTLFPALIFTLSVAWAWQRVGWPGLDVFGLWLALPCCLVVGGLGFGVYHSARWPFPLDIGPYATAVPGSGGLAASIAFGTFALGGPFLLEFLARSMSWGPHVAVFGALALMAGAVVLRVFGPRAADRHIRSDPHRILDLLANRKDEVREAA